MKYGILNRNVSQEHLHRTARTGKFSRKCSIVTQKSGINAPLVMYLMSKKISEVQLKGKFILSNGPNKNVISNCVK